MIALTGYNVLHYLLNRRLISYAEIATDQWHFFEDSFASSQNTNIIARPRSKDQDAYFIKQSRSLSPPNDSLQLEYDVLEIISNTSAKKYIPEFIFIDQADNEEQKLPISYDHRNHVLLVKYVDGSVAFLEYITGNLRRSDFKERFAWSQLLGKSLAELHSTLTEGAVEEAVAASQKKSPELSRIERFQPWILRLKPRDISRFEESNKLYVEKFGAFMQKESTKKIIKNLCEIWDDDPKYLINTDGKFSNVIVVPDGDSQLLFVDWELAGYGPAYWQLAGFAANYLSFLAYENPPLSEGEIWENLNNLFLGYFGNAEFSDDKKITLQYSGLILLQEFFEWGTAEFPSSDSKNPDKFIIGRACLQDPALVWEKHEIEGLKNIH